MNLAPEARAMASSSASVIEYTGLLSASPLSDASSAVNSPSASACTGRSTADTADRPPAQAAEASADTHPHPERQSKAAEAAPASKTSLANSDEHDHAMELLEVGLMYGVLLSFIFWLTWFITAIIQISSRSCIAVCIPFLAVGSAACGLNVYLNLKLPQKFSCVKTLLLTVSFIFFVADPVIIYESHYRNHRVLDKTYTFPAFTGAGLATAQLILLLVNIVGPTVMKRRKQLQVEPASRQPPASAHSIKHLFTTPKATPTNTQTTIPIICNPAIVETDDDDDDGDKDDESMIEVMSFTSRPSARTIRTTVSTDCRPARSAARHASASIRSRSSAWEGAVDEDALFKIEPRGAAHSDTSKEAETESTSAEETNSPEPRVDATDQ